MTLHYASNRTAGYKQVITVPASGATVPDSLKNIVVEVKVAGRTLPRPWSRLQTNRLNLSGTAWTIWGVR